MVTVEVQPIGRVKHIINIVFAVLIIVLYYTVILLPHFPWGILLFLLLTYGVFGIWVIIDFYCRYYRNPYRFDINEDIITIFLKPLLATDKKLTKKAFSDLLDFQQIVFKEYSFRLLTNSHYVFVFQSNLTNKRQWSKEKVSELTSAFILNGYKTRKQIGGWV